MATLDWGDVALIGLVAFVGFSLLSYWISAWMARRNVTGQLKGKPPKRPEAGPPSPKAPAPAAAKPKA